MMRAHAKYKKGQGYFRASVRVRAVCVCGGGGGGGAAVVVVAWWFMKCETQ